MSITESKIIIIGAGLTGLTLAYFLKKENIEVDILEGRDRIGGRIFTKRQAGAAPIELGATWLGRKHTLLVSLLRDLGVETFEQMSGSNAIYEAISTSPPQLVHLPVNEDPSFRIQGGTDMIVQRLQKKIPTERIHLNEKATSIADQGNHIEVQTGSQILRSSIVVSTLPPHLFYNTIRTSPVLPSSINSIARATHTWMGESIKIALTYQKPFWRGEGLSGTIFSNVGPIPEMYDHSNYEDSAYALKGFLNGAYFSVSKEERLELILKQLRKYYGSKADSFTGYHEAVWRNDPLTFTPYDLHILPHQNSGHPIYKEPVMNGKLYIAGSETADQFPGYMEGAVRSAKFVADSILNREFNSTETFQ